jgi:hypothetical protein
VYYYTLITRDKSLESSQFETSWTANAWHLMERLFVLREIPADTKRLLNGDRVYRVHESHVVRLDLDRLERRYVENRSGIYFFDTTDPTSGKAVMDEVWLPVGP